MLSKWATTSNFTKPWFWWSETKE